MKLTIEQLAKLTKLSVPTLRVYVTRKKLGTKVGRDRVFSQADVQKLLKSSKGSNVKAKARPNSTKVRTSKRSLKSKQSKKEMAKRKVVQTRADTSNVKPENRGFWSSLFGARKPKGKVSLLDVNTRK